MLTIINPKNYDVDQFSNLNISENILISTPENEIDYICSNLDGTFSLKLNKDINLAGRQIYNQNPNLIHFTFTPKIKICFPKGILPSFFEPTNINFFYKIYKSFNCFNYFINEYNNIIKTDLPNVIIYQDLNFDIIVDLNILKKSNNTFQLKKRQRILDFSFNYIYFAGCSEISKVKNIYWYQHNEIYYHLLKIL